MNSYQFAFTFAIIAIGSAVAYDLGHSYDVKVQHDHDSHHHDTGYGHHAAAVESHGHDDSGDHSHHDSGDHGHDDHSDYHSHPQYKFEYGVKDAKTKDHHSHWEHRDGDVVKGEYTLDEADGTQRVVEYHADKHNGFNAVVKKIGHAHHSHH